MNIKPQFPLSSILFVFCLVLFPGCSSEETPQVKQDPDEIIPDMPEGTIDAQPVSHRTVSSSSPQISLQVGDQYFFVKSIEQKLGIEPGNPIGRVWERVEFLLSLTVREEVADGYILDVAFHNVLYQSERGEHHLQYDSRSQAPVPPEVIPYRGMINRGFSLHLDRRNRIVDVAGFDEFLAQCFAEFPEESRHKLMLSMGALSGAPSNKIDSAVAFLDESFALLPFQVPADGGDAFPIGNHWTRTFTRTHPLPVTQTFDATLQNVFDEGEWAQVVITGDLKPASPAGFSNDSKNHVAGGTVTGSCSVSLKTGLPKTCRIQREVQMRLAAGNQPAVPVRKTIVTTLEACAPPTANAE